MCVLAAYFCLLCPLMAQSNKLIKELENKRGALQKQIAESESLLKTTTKNVGSQLKGLAALTGQIEERKRYILAINRDVDLIDKELVSLQRQLTRISCCLYFLLLPWSRRIAVCVTSVSMLPISAYRVRRYRRNRGRLATSVQN